MTDNKTQKTAIITGGAKRVGRAITLALSNAGYDVAVIYNSSQQDAQSLKGEIESVGKKISLYQCDISNISSLKSTFEDVFSTHKNISLLVNNASIFEKCDFLSTTEDIFDRHHDINFKAPFFASQFFAQQAIKNKTQNANIVNILDSYIATNGSVYFAYLLSKKSLHDLTLMTAKALGPFVRVNSVSIGQLLTSPDWPQEKIDEIAKILPLRKASSMSNVTDSVLHLVQSEFLTGQNIFVDSGRNLL